MLSRIKFDIDALVNDILDQFPIKTWKSTTTTFLDPAIGGGQFIRDIEKRLRDAGHSDENIAGRVYGCESSKLNVQYAKNKQFARNKYKLVATLSVGDFLKTDFGIMRFDNVVGNPPFQNGDTDSGNFVLWPQFVKKAHRLLSDDGILAMITPQTWASNRLVPSDRSQIAATIRRDVLSRGYVKHVDFSIGKYFPGVGSTFSYFILENKKQDKLTTVVTENGQYLINYDDEPWLKTRIVTTDPIKSPRLKLINGGKETPGYRSGSKNINENGRYPIVNTSAQYSKDIYLCSDTEHPYQRTKKVIFSDSGFAKPFYDSGKFGLGHHARAFEVSSAAEAQIVIDYLNSDYLVDVASSIPNSGSMSHLSKLLAVGFFNDI
jgi:type I restriction-modification system DNA methylase subunit